MNTEETFLHIRVVGWLHVVGAFMLVAAGAFLFLFFAGMGAGAGDPEAFRILGAIGFALIVFMILMSVPGLVAGYGILKRRSWARVIGIVVGALDLPLFPIGTVVGAYTLWILTDKASVDYFNVDVPE